MSSQPQPVILQFDVDDQGGVKISNINKGLDRMGKQATVAAEKTRALDRVMAISTRVVAAGGAAALAAAGGYALMARRMNELDATMKFASSLGMTAKQLTSLDYAMSLAGVKAEKLTEGINKLNIAVGRAGEGDTAMAAALSALGVTFEQLEQLDTEGKLLAVADGLSKITDNSRRAALAAKIFGDGQRQLVAALGQGSAAIRAQQQEAERLGYAITDLYSQRLQEFNDSQERVRRSGKALVDLFAKEFAPVMTRMNNDIAEAATKHGWLGEAAENAALGAETAYLTLKTVITDTINEQRELMKLAREGRSAEFVPRGLQGGIIIPPAIPAALEVIRARREEADRLKKAREEADKLAKIDAERAALARAHTAEGEAMVAALLAEADALDAARQKQRELAAADAQRLADLESQTAELNRQADILARNLRMQQGGIAAGNVPGPLGGNVGGVYGTFEEFGAQREMLIELETMQAESIARQIELQEMGSAEAIRIAEANAARQIEINRARNAAILGLTAGLAGETAATMENYARATGKKSREMALAQKGLAIGQATINTYLAASAAMASSAVLGPVAAAAAAKIITALGLANVALIAATPLETYHDGGLVTGPGGGQFGGRRLRADEVPAVLQTGEVVLSRADVAMMTGKSGGSAGQPATPAAGPTVQAVILREEDLENWAMSRRGRRAINMAVER
jgi:hypothetical protein